MKNMFWLHFGIPAEVRHVQRETDLEVPNMRQEESRKEEDSYGGHLARIHARQTDARADCSDVRTQHEVGAAAIAGRDC